MAKDDAVYYAHMVEAARKAMRLMAGKTREEFERDEVLQLAIVHLLQIVGEAARLVSPRGRATVSQLPWKLITGMRHKLVHDYLHVDLDIVWDTVQRSLKPLVAELEPHLPPAPPSA